MCEYLRDKINDLTPISGRRELLHLELKVAVLREAVEVLGQDPRLSSDHDSLSGAAVRDGAVVRKLYRQ